jgi:hypothetical protein
VNDRIGIERTALNQPGRNGRRPAHSVSEIATIRPQISAQAGNATTVRSRFPGRRSI